MNYNDQVLSLVDALESNTALKSLDLSRNKITDVGSVIGLLLRVHSIWFAWVILHRRLRDRGCTAKLTYTQPVALHTFKTICSIYSTVLVYEAKWLPRFSMVCALSATLYTVHHFVQYSFDCVGVGAE